MMLLAGSFTAADPQLETAGAAGCPLQQRQKGEKDDINRTFSGFCNRSNEPFV